MVLSLDRRYGRSPASRFTSADLFYQKCGSIDMMYADKVGYVWLDDSEYTLAHLCLNQGKDGLGFGYVGRPDLPFPSAADPVPTALRLWRPLGSHHLRAHLRLWFWRLGLNQGCRFAKFCRSRSRTAKSFSLTVNAPVQEVSLTQPSLSPCKGSSPRVCREPEWQRSVRDVPCRVSVPRHGEAGSFLLLCFSGTNFLLSSRNKCKRKILGCPNCSDLATRASALGQFDLLRFDSSWAEKRIGVALVSLNSLREGAKTFNIPFSPTVVPATSASKGKGRKVDSGKRRSRLPSMPRASDSVLRAGRLAKRTSGSAQAARRFRIALSNTKRYVLRSLFSLSGTHCSHPRRSTKICTRCSAQSVVGRRSWVLCPRGWEGS